MALFSSSLCAHLSLARIYCLRSNSIRNSLYSPHVSCHIRSPLCRQYYSSKVRRGFGRYVSSKLLSANNKYEEFLKRRFPRVYNVHRIFVDGFKLLFQDANEARKIKMKLHSERLQYKDLPYREMEKLRQFRRNMIKAIPLVLASIPPFSIYLVFAFMYFFPRHIQIPHFWTPQQQVSFRMLSHSLRAQHFVPVLRGLEQTNHKVKDALLQRRLKDLCSKVQHGSKPKVMEILAVRGLFSGPPLGMRRLPTEQMRQLSRLLFLTPHLPGFIVGRRLNSHALELLHLDRALCRLGPHQLSEAELKQACYLRGLNSDGLGVEQCRVWLSQWLQVSMALKESEVSLLLHTIVFLSNNSSRAPKAALTGSLQR